MLIQNLLFFMPDIDISMISLECDDAIEVLSNTIGKCVQEIVIKMLWAHRGENMAC